MKLRQIATGISIGGQPTPDEITQLHSEGFHTLVNVRTPEDDGYLPAEERLAENTGMSYTEIPISPVLIDDMAVMRFSQALDSDDAQPAYVHCGSGGRAGLMVLLHLAVKNGWSLQRALEEGEKMGVAPSQTSPYREFFEGYIRRHSAGERAAD